MAVVLNDLLGISTPNRAKGGERVDFPTYEEFVAKRQANGAPRDYAYNDDRAYANDNAYSEDYSRNSYNNNNYENNYEQVNRNIGYSRDNYASEAVRPERNAYAQNSYYGEQGYAEQNSFQAREGEKYNTGSYGVSSRTSQFNNAEQANGFGSSNACLYSVMDEISQSQNSEFENNLFDRLAFNSPLAKNQQNISVSTRRYAAEKAASRPKKASKLSLKGKIILAVYVALAVLIVTLVLINASGFNGTNRDTSVGNSVSYTETSTEVAEQATATSVAVSSTDTVSFDYVSSNLNYAESTNWFDRLCDNLSKVFG